MPQAVAHAFSFRSSCRAALLHQGLEILAGHIAVTQDSGEEAGAYNFGSVHRDSRDTAVRMAQPMMTALDPHDNEACLLQSGNELTAGKTRQSAHAGTVTR